MLTASQRQRLHVIYEIAPNAMGISARTLLNSGKGLHNHTYLFRLFGVKSSLSKVKRRNNNLTSSQVRTPVANPQLSQSYNFLCHQLFHVSISLPCTFKCSSRFWLLLLSHRYLSRTLRKTVVFEKGVWVVQIQTGHHTDRYLVCVDIFVWLHLL